MCKPLPKLATMLIATSACALTACATMMGSSAPTSPAPHEFCLLAKPIYWSAHDTDDTIKQAKAHNAVGKALCGWGTKPAAPGS